MKHSLFVLASLALLFTSVRVSQAQEALWFQEEFDSASLDPSKWRGDLLDGGKRWCDAHAGFAQGPGAWIDPANEPCFSVSQALPFGGSALGSGVLSIAGGGSRTTCYLPLHSPAVDSLVPPVGDFRIVARLRVNNYGTCGSGITLLRLADTSPTAAAPAILDSIVCQVWVEDNGVNLNTFSSVGGSNVSGQLVPATDHAFHDYEIAYSGGQYTFSVDSTPVRGPLASNLRPSAVWIGNPILSFGTTCGWGQFDVDFIRTFVPMTTPARIRTWGALKAHYR